ncbi:MAG: Trk family potassium uptake protein [Clostridia bacterium]|nr:Trk family potassium uptake protein [Clostridia bacterium]
MKPARLISISFLLLISIGTLLLVLPSASKDGQSIGFLRAFFTSTSAVCVTGLVTVDTASHWTLFGQIVIMSLIQCGGLGLITITTFFFVLARRKLGFKTMIVAQESTASFSFNDVVKLVRRIVVITVSIEMVGAILLASRYIPAFGFSRGGFKAVFQAVSAFCNAGFDLLGDTASGPFSSLTAWNGEPMVILVTGFLLILGGLGFIVISSIIEYPKKKMLPYHSRLVLITTAILLLSGTVFFFIAEYGNTGKNALGTLPFGQKILAAFFQSTTPRTAGFNSIDQGNLTDSSKIMTTLLMFIGASPGSTGGGIKTTTFALLLASVFAELRGSEYTILLRHRISRAIFNKSFLILALGLSVVILTTLFMTFTEHSLLESGKISTLDLLFEATSAFGTVGLSSAGTPGLSEPSWVALSLSMIIGRIGPASFAISLMQGAKPETREKVYPEGRCIVG